MQMPQLLKAHALWFFVCLGMTGFMFLQEGDAVQHAPKSDRIELPAPQTEGSRTTNIRSRPSAAQVGEKLSEPSPVPDLGFPAALGGPGDNESDGLSNSSFGLARAVTPRLQAAGNVEGLSAGLYRYINQGHQLDRLDEGDRREDLLQGRARSDSRFARLRRCS